MVLLVLAATSKVRLTDVSEGGREGERAHNAIAAFDLFREVMIMMPSLMWSGDATAACAESQRQVFLSSPGPGTFQKAENIVWTVR